MALLAGCSQRPDGLQPAAYESATRPDIADWDRDRLGGWLAAFQRSCTRKPWLNQTLADPGAWRAVCRDANAAAAIDSDWISRRFAVGRMTEDALVTGYFEPSLAGSRKPAEAYPVPIYRAPPASSPRRQLPRAAIDAGGLDGQGLELLWLADPVDAFFLHIQGSGQVRFPDGSIQRIGYAGDNGQPYHAIGRDLVAGGQIARENIAMQSIAAWLRAHPDAGRAMMQRNPRYIFFRPVDGAGPVGAQAVALVPERSLAVDPRHTPYGLPVWLDVEHPDPRAKGRLQRLTVAQDTGSAIKGPDRADFFWGAGARAVDLAGRMQSRGRLYVLLPRRVTRQ